jgi:hypothetical protein
LSDKIKVFPTDKTNRLKPPVHAEKQNRWLSPYEIPLRSRRSSASVHMRNHQNISAVADYLWYRYLVK